MVNCKMYKHYQLVHCHVIGRFGDLLYTKLLL
nr:CPPV342 hypothetical protein [Cooks petrelpox virus]